MLGLSFSGFDPQRISCSSSAELKKAQAWHKQGRSEPDSLTDQLSGTAMSGLVPDLGRLPPRLEPFSKVFIYNGLGTSLGGI
jgi:hypothetical protein